VEILQSRAYIGIIEYRDIEINVPELAVIPREQWHAAQSPSDGIRQLLLFIAQRAQGPVSRLPLRFYQGAKGGRGCVALHP